MYHPSLGTSLSKRKTATHVHCIGNAVYGLDKMKTMIENCGGSISWQVVRILTSVKETAFKYQLNCVKVLNSKNIFYSI